MNQQNLDVVASSQHEIIQKQSQQSSFHSQFTDNYHVEKRRLKNNKFKVYKCVCGKKHHDKNQMISHKLKCNNRKKIQKFNSQSKVDNQIGASLQKYRHSLQQNELREDQLSDIKQRLSRLQQNHQAHNVLFDAYSRAKIIFDKYQGAISGIIINKIATSLEGAFRVGIKVLQIQNTISAAIIGKLQSLNFDQCMQPLSQKLLKAHQMIMENSNKKTEKTKKYNQRAFNFLSQFNQFELNTQIRFFDEFLQCDPTQRKNVARYFSKIRKIDPFFSKFPQIPKLSQNIPRNIMLSKTTIQDAASEIRQIYTQTSPQLACDMWMIITLGLRFHDLLKIFFEKQDHIVKFIRLKENKNNNICVRFIPESLVKMVFCSNTKYPATTKRLRIAVKQCLKRFKSSYGFKHRAITAILTALHQSNPLARMHAHAQMTVKHYIDKNDEKFINSAFKMGINFIFDNELSNRINNRNTELDLSLDKPQIKQLSLVTQKQITIQCENILRSRLTSSALDGAFEPDSSTNLSKKEEDQLNEISFISKQHNIEMIQTKFRRVEQALGILDQEHHIAEITQQLLIETGESINQQLIINKLAEVTDREVHLYDFSDDIKNPEHLSTQSIDEDKDIILISKNKYGYSISQKNVQLPKRHAAVKALQRLQSPKIFHNPFPPACRICRKNKIYSKLFTTQNGIQCKKCQYKMEKFGALYPLKSSIQIISEKEETFDGYECVKLCKHKNNLVIKVEEKYPGKYKQVCSYSQDFPDKICTSFKKSSKKFMKQVQKCRKNIENLPLSIKKSNILNAGDGLFSTQIIPKNKLLLTYTGIIGTSFSIIEKEENDSLFEAGWVTTKNDTDQVNGFQVIIDGASTVGPSRYINSSQNYRQSNCAALMTIHGNQILIYFYSKQQIKKGEEILFYYGQNYWKKQNEINEADKSEVSQIF